jgi:two-component system NtrC family sensor kinase
MTVDAPQSAPSPGAEKRHPPRVIRAMRGALANALGRRVIAWILLSSCVIALLSASVQLYALFHREVAQIDRNLDALEHSSMAGLAYAVWNIDQPQIEAQLAGLRALPDVNYVAVSDTNGKVLARSGVRPVDAIVRSFPIVIDPLSGIVRGRATLDGVYDRVGSEAVAALASQLAETLLGALAALLIFRNLVSRPLSELARAAGDADLARLGNPIELHRGPHETDDFDILVSEMNRRRASLKHEVDALQAARDALARHRAELEIRVAERTAELCDKVTELEQRREEQARLFQDLETARNQAIQAEKLASIGQLAAGVAHEINNPVGFVLSNFGSLERYVEDLLRVLSAYEAVEPLVPAGAPQLAMLASARTAADIDYIKEDLGQLVAQSRDGLDRVRRIVQDLKDFAHAGEAHWQRADLVRGLESTLNVVRNEIKYKAEVVKRCEPLPDVECVPSQLNQVFMNLLVNAAQAITDRGTITIACGTRDEEVWIDIEDTGCGMAPDVARRIFDPFFTTKPVGQGTGLGLSVSYSIVKRHGGRIEVDSTPGQGTRFRVWMPIAQPVPELAQAA